MNLLRVFGVGLVALLLLSGCQGNNSDTPTNSRDTNGSVVVPPEGNITNPAVTVILPVSSTVLTTNSQVVTIDVRVFDSANNPYSKGEVKLINSPDVRNGRDVGTFSQYASKLINGVATFTYTAPKDLSADTSNIYFGFYHDSDPSNIKQYTMSIVPETNQTIISSYKLVSSNGENVKLALNSTKAISYNVQDSNNNKIADDDIISLTVTSLNPGIATLSDSYGNKNLSTLTVTEKNTITVNVNTNTKSGLIPLKVEAHFLDANHEEKDLTKVYSVVVLSGPPTAFSLSFAGTSQDKEHAKFIDHWVLTATDKYSNLINTKPTISTGMITGYAQSSASTATNSMNYLYSIPPRGGSIENATPHDKFNTSEDFFSNVDFEHDYLVTFGNGYTYDASGKWDINKSNSDNNLLLVENYYGNNVSGLGFAVGNNYRQDTCDFGAEWVGNVYPKNNNYILDENASTVLDMEYDYYLTGKSVVFWINLIGSANGKDTRVGEARKILLRGVGFDDNSVSVPAGTTGKTYEIPISLKNTSEWYRNGNFGAKIVTSDNITHGKVIFHGQVGGCYSPRNSAQGTAYVEVEDVNETQSKTGTITVTDIVVGSEF